MSDMSEIQILVDDCPNADNTLLAICEIARLSHAGKHGQRIRELLQNMIDYYRENP